MVIGRVGSGGHAPGILQFYIFLENFLREKVVFLVSSGQIKFHYLFPPRKIFLATPGKFTFGPLLEKKPSGAHGHNSGPDLACFIMRKRFKSLRNP